jgi:hypothetical protein
VDVGPLPEGNYIHDNTFSNNGYDPDPVVAELGIPSGDILWETTGAGNRFDESGATSFPPVLPGSGWPDFMANAYGNFWRALLAVMG